MTFTVFNHSPLGAMHWVPVIKVGNRKFTIPFLWGILKGIYIITEEEHIQYTNYNIGNYVSRVNGLNVINYSSRLLHYHATLVIGLYYRDKDFSRT